MTGHLLILEETKSLATFFHASSWCRILAIRGAMPNSQLQCVRPLGSRGRPFSTYHILASSEVQVQIKRQLIPARCGRRVEKRVNPFARIVGYTVEHNPPIRVVLYRHLIPAPVDRTYSSAWLYTHSRITSTNKPSTFNSCIYDLEKRCFMPGLPTHVVQVLYVGTVFKKKKLNLIDTHRRNNSLR